MSRTRAHITQADVARTIRAAKQAGAAGVEVRPDGTIYVHLCTSRGGGKLPNVVEKDLEVDGGAVL
ncbi:hypothetical protein [Bradyrhizobium sp. AUGA SZCCT0182]|uniref:hypothetical protein n=1 Tax=Bradyrhizobium sp. AUGA SZCCT0182 TaxID=2807667 RepID=UPI001BA5AD99|nr:hypothetical protein [Bradyrhizobium sp. AUGA SZCCT0182]MBR1236603.1 hypothetical protein [Bradyrhizobium sp. AUGA SZCCT0182]